ncbi:N-acyl homoserine lactonase family protein [Shimazuella sp. AN120528]|uniref:N-acyl homoserine lactonase family protein n=1 Tax=Shimazuella soli TaxID=1892854 RepID=UPI001F0D76AC|nr:N-acyl homoserine lactonase family protein [Shimazuella soli]MCH5584917.1 N-acyl homoserine lactonase family protein [Shimazuella soli]
MKIHVLQTGYTKVPFGQFYGGLNGWIGNRAVWNMIFDKSHFINVPIHVYLIEHPHVGPILIDTGISMEQAREHKSYYKGIFGVTTDEDEYVLEDNMELTAQLDKLGYCPSDIQTVVLTHLHEDHVGELNRFSHARVMVPLKEWESRHDKVFGFRPIYYPPSYSSIKNWDFVSFTSGAFHSFDASQDLFGDGSLIFLPTPGHSKGHASLLVRTDEETHVFLTGDSLYTLRHLDFEHLCAFVPGPKKDFHIYLDTIKRIRELRKALPNMVIVPTHDHYDYQYKYVHRFFEDGILTEEERDQLLQYEASLFDQNGHLKPEAYPAFVSKDKQKGVGKVCSEVS